MKKLRYRCSTTAIFRAAKTPKNPFLHVSCLIYNTTQFQALLDRLVSAKQDRKTTYYLAYKMRETKLRERHISTRWRWSDSQSIKIQLCIICQKSALAILCRSVNSLSSTICDSQIKIPSDLRTCQNYFNPPSNNTILK